MLTPVAIDPWNSRKMPPDQQKAGARTAKALKIMDAS
jgi:hypothetical protein